MPHTTPVPTFHHKVYPSIDPTNPDISVTGKVVVITGGGQGIGRATARAFAIAGAAHIVITGRKLSTLNDTKSSIEQIPGNTSKVHVFQADIVSQDQMSSTFTKIVNTIGRVDVLVANAGYLSTTSPISTVSVDEIKKAYEINVIGSLITFQEFLKVKADGPVTVISTNTFASVRGYMGPWPGYLLSKWAVLKVLEGLAAEHQDVRVFSFHPGVVLSDMSAEFGAAAVANDDEELPAAFSVWLASPKSEFLRGTFLWSNWDVDELAALKPNFEQDPNFLKIGQVGESNFKYSAASPFDP